MFACSFWKRQLETSSRYSYLVTAFKGMKQWIAKGDDDTTKMKRFIMRHLQIPADLKGEVQRSVFARARRSLTRPP